jgi:HK97 gp10 family phage protein
LTAFLKVEGIEDIQEMLKERAPRVARNLMRATVQAIASNIAKDAKKDAPKRSGNLRKSIKAKRKKSPADQPVSQVIVGEGKGEKPNAFYWKFVEYGTQHSAAHPFITPAKQRAQANMKTLLVEEFGKKLEKQLAREAKSKK